MIYNLCNDNSIDNIISQYIKRALLLKNMLRTEYRRGGITRYFNINIYYQQKTRSILKIFWSKMEKLSITELVDRRNGQLTYITCGDWRFSEKRTKELMHMCRVNNALDENLLRYYLNCSTFSKCFSIVNGRRRL